MSQIKEVNVLGTIASIRKATQQSLKPIIQEIERKMVIMSRQTIELASKTQKISDLQKRQNRSEESIRYLQSQVQDLKQHCQSIQLQQSSDKQQFEKSEQKLRQDFRKLSKQKQKQDAIIQTMKDRNERMNKQVNTALQSMKVRQQALQGRFKTLSQRSQKLSFDVKSNSQKMSSEFEIIKNSLNHELKQNSRRLSLLDMYQAQKDIINDKLKSIFEQIQKLVKIQDYQFYKQCINKQQQRVINIVKKIIQDNFTQQIKNLLLQLPQMRQNILYCLTYQQKINILYSNINQLNQIIKYNKNQIDINYNKFKIYIDDKFINNQQQHLQMIKLINKALLFQTQMISKLDQYSNKLKQQLRQQNYLKSRELYNQIKISFADKKQQIRQKQLQKIIQQRQKLFDRSLQMENIANKISQILTNFSTRITKIKSDNQIFLEKVKKQLLSIDHLKKIINHNSSLTGEILSQIMQTILVIICIDVQKQSKNDQEIAFSTHYDGVIYQKYNHKPGQVGTILYRRKIMTSKIIKRALIASLTQQYDKLMDQDNCLCWNDHPPSNYFKDQIEPIYQNLLEKLAQDNDKIFKNKKMKDNDSFGLQLPKDTILTAFQNNQSIHRKYNTTHRSRKTRYDGGEIFLAKSARRGRGSLNSTIALE